MKTNMISKLISLLLIIGILTSGCASSTLLQTTPPNVSVYIKGQIVGTTPYSYTDRKTAGATTLITLKKEGYEDYYTTLRKDERWKAATILASIFILPLIFWATDYHPVHSYELEKIEEVAPALPAEDLVNTEPARQAKIDDEKKMAEENAKLISDYNSSGTAIKSDLNYSQETVKLNEGSVLIKGFLVNTEGNPLKGKSMKVYISNSKTTVDTYKDEPKKDGLGKQILGTGKLALNIEGVEGGGALKLIDGAVVNPNAMTDNKGNFIFNASAKFIEDASEFIIAVDFINDYSTMVTVSYPLVDEEGNPVILKIDENIKVINLGKVRTLKDFKEEFAELNKENSVEPDEKEQTNFDSEIKKTEDVSKPILVPAQKKAKKVARADSKKKKTNSLFPEGEELITLLSATISPESITTSGSVVTVKYKNNESISTDKLIPVVVFVTNAMTITTRTYSGNIFNSDNIVFRVSNPASSPGAYNNYSMNTGQLSGSGTIYCYFEESGNSNDKEDKKRVSNVLSIYATFKQLEHQ